MKSISRINLLFLLLLTSANSCEKGKVNVLLQEMVKFDQSFIPVLYYVQHNELDNAKKSIFVLKKRWEELSKTLKQEFQEGDDSDIWTGELSAWLSNAYIAIDAGAAIESYIFLDQVRYQMIDWRRELGMKYFLDEIWELEAQLDLVEEVATDPMMCLMDFCEFEELVVGLNQTWRMIRLSKEEEELFGMDDESLFKLEYKSKIFKDALGKFNRAVIEADSEAMAYEISQLKNAYLSYLAVFGDFESSKSYLAEL